MDLTQYTSLYLQEMRDNLAQLNRHVVALERNPTNVELLQEIMRLSHSGKGSSNAMGFKSTAELFHALEDVFDAARKAKLTITKDVITLCLKAFDVIQHSFDTMEQTKHEIDCTGMATIIRSSVARVGQPTVTSPTPMPLQEPMDSPPSTDAGTKVDFIRVGTQKIEKLTEIAGEFTLLRERMATVKHPALTSVLEQMTRLVDDLTYYATEIRLVPLEQAFGRFPRLVRDLATSQQKDVRFEMSGIDVELDKTLVDHLVSPLVHLLRNAVDHGVERPEVRTHHGKAAEATIRLSVEREQGFARVSVEDDGAPIVLSQLKEIAKQRGIAAATLEHITEDTILDLITMPGFSTSQTVSTVSGRGVGLSAVLQAAKSLGGHLTLTQQNGKKTFTLSLPLKLSIIQSLLVQSGEQVYAIPLVHIRRLLTVPRTSIRSTLGEPAIVIDGEEVPLIALSALFRAKDVQTTDVCVVLVEVGHGRVGFMVDMLRGKADIMVKPISSALQTPRCFAGSTLLSSGHVALIVDVPAVVERSTEHMKRSTASPPHPHE